jgi:hypothetical protein
MLRAQLEEVNRLHRVKDLETAKKEVEIQRLARQKEEGDGCCATPSLTRH